MRRFVKELGFRPSFIPDHNSWRETSFYADILIKLSENAKELGDSEHIM